MDCTETSINAVNTDIQAMEMERPRRRPSRKWKWPKTDDGRERHEGCEPTWTTQWKPLRNKCALINSGGEDLSAGFSDVAGVDCSRWLAERCC